jgi:glycosyltransferase involved in cell wall biosynthesis
MAYIIISPQVWSDNWVSKHWIAHWLAERGEEVYYIEPFRDRGGPVRSFLHGPRTRMAGNVRVVSFATLPYYYHAPTFLKPLWRLILKRQFERFSSRLRGKSIDIVTFDGRSLPFLAMLPKPRRSAYYCVDPVMVGEEKKFSEKTLMEKVDRVLAISAACKAALVRDTGLENIEVIPHGIDFKGAMRATALEAAAATPDDLPSGRPLIGYTGSIHDIYVDFDKVTRAARENPNWTFVFVGPYKGSDIAQDASSRISALMELPNVHFTGSKPYQQLRHYIEAFDVCLIPYRADIENGWEKRSPVKVLHYLSLGKPIVCADVPGVREYGAALSIYRDYAEFVAAIRTGIAESAQDPKRAARIDLAASRDCDLIMAELLSLLE